MSRRLSSYIVKKISVDNGENTKVEIFIPIEKFNIIN